LQQQLTAEATSLRRRLARHRSNLAKLEEQKALYGAAEVPLYLQNQLEAEQQAIDEIENKLHQLQK
jgi:hypothetical protein